MKKFLLPVDGSETSFKALDKAIELANPCEVENPEAEIVVMGVVPPTPMGYHRGNISVSKSTVQKINDEMKEVLGCCKTAITTHGIKATVLLAEGSAGEAIVEEANKEDEYDGLIIGSRGLSGAEKFFLGSVSSYVVERAVPSIFLVKPHLYNVKGRKFTGV